MTVRTRRVNHMRTKIKGTKVNRRNTRNLSKGRIVKRSRSRNYTRKHGGLGGGKKGCVDGIYYDDFTGKKVTVEFKNVLSCKIRKLKKDIDALRPMTKNKETIKRKEKELSDLITRMENHYLADYVSPSKTAAKSSTTSKSSPAPSKRSKLSTPPPSLSDIRPSKKKRSKKKRFSKH